MVKKIFFFVKNNFVNIFIYALFLLSLNTYSQCAGQDATITICNIQDPANSSIDLFSLLQGNPAPGGIWIDNSKGPDENEFNGILNAQLLNSSGVYTYTYVQNSVEDCTDNEATVTLNIGPYAGVPSPNVSTCDDVTNFNLFLAFDGTKLPPQQNGVWTISGTSTALAGNTINPQSLGEGTYSYTYTIPQLADCEEQSETIFVTVFRKPISGSPSNLIVCSTDDLAQYRNLNLNTRLVGEDTGGRWSDPSGTNEITTLSDNRIDVERIYNSFGAGTYNFVYTVTSPNPICTDSRTQVQIVIEEPLDFTGSTLVVNSDICEDEIPTATYTATLTKGPQPIPDGEYDLVYEISNGTSTTTVAIEGNFVAGVFTFDINRIYFPAIADYTVRITSIRNKDFYNVCTNIIGNISDVLTVAALPRINNATLTIEPICKGLAAQVVLSGDTNLTNGNYRISYNLSGNNTANNQELEFTVTDGVGGFQIPANLLPNVGVNTTFRITNIVNLTTGCENTANLSKVFTVKPLPNLDNVVISINNICFNQPATVQITGLTNLTNVTINYSLSDANTHLNQELVLSVNSGSTGFVIPSEMLTNTGSTIFVLNSVLNNTNGCVAMAINKSKAFLVNTIPSNPPVASFNFCKNDLRTIANLSPNGTQFQWFDSVSSTTVLSPSTVLVTGTYYVKEVNPTTGCESSRSPILVTINELESPTLETNGQIFCGLDNPTLQDLSDKTNFTDDLIWFDALENGNELATTTLLKEGMTYYGFSYSDEIDCYSNPLEVTVSLSNCEAPPSFFIPDGFSPNGDNKNDTFRIQNIEFIYPDFILEIYNRYGSLMFRGNKNNSEWTGRNSDYNVGIDGMAPNGVYFYVLHYNKGNKQPTQGKLYLNR